MTLENVAVQPVDQTLDLSLNLNLGHDHDILKSVYTEKRTSGGHSCDTNVDS